MIRKTPAAWGLCGMLAFLLTLAAACISRGPLPELATPTFTLVPEASLVPRASAIPFLAGTPTISASPTASPAPAPPPTRGPSPTPNAAEYLAMPGDTLFAVAARFGVPIEALSCAGARCPVLPNPDTPGGAPPQTLLDPGTRLLLPPRADRPPARLLPDSEVVFSAAAADFDPAAYLETTAGYLKTHRQYLMISGWATGAEIVARVAVENSANPRLLLALLETQCRCVLGSPAGSPEPFMGAAQYYRPDLYGQLIWAVRELFIGYYGWRAGTLTSFALADGTLYHPPPASNAGTVAVQYLFAQLYGKAEWEAALAPETGFPAVYREMFGDSWARAIPLYPPGLGQPELTLPFEAGKIWSFSGGPHPAWEGNGPLAALDFAPKSAASGCEPSDAWVVAAAPGLVVRAGEGVVVTDLDGDGLEQTGWVLVYLHVEARDQVMPGVRLAAGDAVGHPSCEGGRATGTHVHLVRKFNGEWIPAGDPLPFTLSGWVAEAGAAPYLGTLTRGGENRIACTCSSAASWIVREK